ncbi:MAG: hypothetical protein QOE68_198 [Thermoanaerobaculia bacterium]|nr:hypothetical protein [Thermoanaerobaculia bacterium]
MVRLLEKHPSIVIPLLVVLADGVEPERAAGLVEPKARDLKGRRNLGPFCFHPAACEALSASAITFLHQA